MTTRNKTTRITTTHTNVRRWRRAFTLIETVATLTILGAMGSVAAITIFTAIDGYMRAATQAQVHAELSNALDTIDREVRKIALKSGSGTAPNITGVTPTSLTWSGSGGNSSLTLTSGQLRMTLNGGSPAIVLDNVTGVTIQAFNQDNVSLAGTLNATESEAVRRISIQLTVQRSGMTESLRTRVFLRSTMSGSLS